MANKYIQALTEPAGIRAALSSYSIPPLIGLGSHVAQNVAMKHLVLPSERFGKRVGEVFAEGFHGVHDASLSRKLKDTATSLLMPDMNLITNEVRQAGEHAAQIYNNMNLRQQAAAKALHQTLVEHGSKLKALEQFKKPTRGILSEVGPVRAVREGLYRAGNVSRVLSSKKHPLTSNIGKNILTASLQKDKEYKVGSGYAQDQATAFLGAALGLGAVGMLPVLPEFGAISAFKAALGNKYLNQKSKALSRISDQTAKQYREAFDQPNKAHISLKDRITEYGASPMMIEPKRTASALSAALSGINPKHV